MTKFIQIWHSGNIIPILLCFTFGMIQSFFFTIVIIYNFLSQSIPNLKCRVGRHINLKGFYSIFSFINHLKVCNNFFLLFFATHSSQTLYNSKQPTIPLVSALVFVHILPSISNNLKLTFFPFQTVQWVIKATQAYSTKAKIFWGICSNICAYMYV